jgi:hypothetical protein
MLMDFLASLLRWTSLGRNNKGNGIFRAYSNVSPQYVTTPIRNADFWAKTNGLCIFMRSQNLWDFALDKKKINQNKKLLLRAQTETKSFLKTALRIA